MVSPGCRATIPARSWGRRCPAISAGRWSTRRVGGQPVVPPTVATPGVDEAERRRLAEEKTARLSRVFFQTEARTGALAGTPAGVASPNLAGLGLAGQLGTPTAQDRQLAFLNAAVDRRTVATDHLSTGISEEVGLFGPRKGCWKSTLRLGNESLQCVSTDAKRAESRFQPEANREATSKLSRAVEKVLRCPTNNQISP
jgi:hypothetical protein